TRIVRARARPNAALVASQRRQAAHGQAAAAQGLGVGVQVRGAQRVLLPAGERRWRLEHLARQDRRFLETGQEVLLASTHGTPPLLERKNVQRPCRAVSRVTGFASMPVMTLGRPISRFTPGLLLIPLVLANSGSESGLQNPNQPQLPQGGGKDGGAGKGAKPGAKRPAPGTATVGVYRPGDATFLLRNTNAPGEPEVTVAFGAKGDLPVVGDWNGDGVFTVGVFRPSEGKFLLRNTNTPGEPEITITFGSKDDLPLGGDC